MVNYSYITNTIRQLEPDIRCLETASSWLFLGREHVYKFLRPLSRGYQVQFSKEERLHRLVREMSWNFVHSSHLKYQLISLKDDQAIQGRVMDGFDSEASEYGLRMRRLPTKAQFSANLYNGFTECWANKLAKILREHLIMCNPIYIDPALYLHRLECNLNLQRELLSNIDVSKHLLLLVVKTYETAYKTLQSNKDLLVERCQSGNVRRCHGDLQIDHIFLDASQVVFIDPSHSDELSQIDEICEISTILNDLTANYGMQAAQLLEDSLQVQANCKSLLRFFRLLKSLVRARFLLYQNQNEDQAMHYLMAIVDDQIR